MATNVSDVYLGFWVDQSEENVLLKGKMTISSEVAKFLTAFFVMYVTFAASKLWDVVAYLIHFLRQGKASERGRLLLRQQQVTLKNSVSPGTTSHRLLKIWWVNRAREYSLRDSFSLVMFAAFCGIGCLGAGLYAPNVVDISPKVKVLINSPNCGFVDGSGSVVSNNLTMAVKQFYLDSLAGATDYSRKCYNTSSTEDCGPFTESRVDWDTNWDADCPFNDSMCLGPAMELDTGEMNSNKVLGLNSKFKDQISLRKVTTCAPILQDGYTAHVPSDQSTSTAVSHINGDEIVMNVYGPSRHNLGGNYTWSVSEYAASSERTRTMQMEHYYNGLPANRGTFSPIPEIDNSTGDGTLCFVSSNALLFVEPCDDPVFSAHVPRYDATGNFTYYLEDRVTGVIGCLEQYQWCNPSTEICTLIGSLADTREEVAQVLSLTATQNATVHMLYLVLSSLANIPFLGSNTGNLVANQKVNGNIQFPLPNNQWQVEVQAWHGIVMKLLQEGILRWVIGPTDPILKDHLLPPASPEQAALCHLQRIQPGQGAGVASVTTFGFFFVLVVGTLVILASVFADNIADLVGRWSETVREKQQAWLDDDALQLQRVAYEADARAVEEVTGRSPGVVWTGRDGDVPAVEGNDTVLGPLPSPSTIRSRDTIPSADTITEERETETTELPFAERPGKAPKRRYST